MSGMIAGLHTSSITLVSGSYAYPVTNLGTIDITASGPALYAASRWSVVNLGTIVGENTSGSSGILLAGGGSITNAAAGLIEGYVAVTISGGGYVDNASNGTIAGWGGVYGGGTSASALTLVNSGQILGTRYSGVLAASGFVSNATGGTIFGAATGIFDPGAPLTVLNSGTIVGSILRASSSTPADPLPTGRAVYYRRLVDGHLQRIHGHRDGG